MPVLQSTFCSVCVKCGNVRKLDDENKKKSQKSANTVWASSMWLKKNTFLRFFLSQSLWLSLWLFTNRKYADLCRMIKLYRGKNFFSLVTAVMFRDESFIEAHCRLLPTFETSILLSSMNFASLTLLTMWLHRNLRLPFLCPPEPRRQSWHLFWVE